MMEKPHFSRDGINPVDSALAWTANNMDDVIAIARLLPGAHSEYLFGGGIEVRPLDQFEHA
jgi:hypothetical protein